MSVDSAKRAHDKDGLTKRQRAFCDAYIETRNGQQSAITAGYSQKTARYIASTLLTNQSVARYIDQRLSKIDLAEREKIRARIASGDEVNAFLSDVMKGNVKDAFGLDPGLSDRISAAKELRRIYDVIDKYKATVTDTDALSQSLDAFINGELAPDQADAETETE